MLDARSVSNEMRMILRKKSAPFPVLARFSTQPHRVGLNTSAHDKVSGKLVTSLSELRMTQIAKNFRQYPAGEVS